MYEQIAHLTRQVFPSTMMGTAQHRRVQDYVQATLVSLALAFEQGHHIRIDADGQLLLDRTVELAAHGILPLIRL